MAGGQGRTNGRARTRRTGRAGRTRVQRPAGASVVIPATREGVCKAYPAQRRVGEAALLRLERPQLLDGACQPRVVGIADVDLIPARDFAALTLPEQGTDADIQPVAQPRGADHEFENVEIVVEEHLVAVHRPAPGSAPMNRPSVRSRLAAGV